MVVLELELVVFDCNKLEDIELEVTADQELVAIEVLDSTLDIGSCMDIVVDKHSCLKFW